MQVNLNAPFFLTQACLPLLSAAKDGRLLFTTDQVGLHGKAYWGAYAASKAGIERLAEVLAAEFENTPLLVNWIDPGPTCTALRKVAFPGEENTSLKQPESLQALYLWAMGPDSRDTHGQRLAYRGG
jgi:NAD(P)-dependent dehydrogenase (short-subunit alcohol dehydrogenase family)